MKKTAAVLIAMLFITGCSWQKDTRDKRIKSARIDQITEGTTKIGEVFDTLGTPSEITLLKNGTILEYRFAQTKALRAFMFLVNFANYETKFDRVLVYLDNKDVVKKVTSDFEAENTRYEMPWSNVPEDKE